MPRSTAPASLPCPICRQRPLQNAVRVYRAEARPSPLPPILDHEILLACRPCLAASLARGFASLTFSRKGGSGLHRPAKRLQFAARNLFWWLVIRWAPRTFWMRDLLQEAGFEGRPGRNSAANQPWAFEQRRELAQALVCLMRAVAQADGHTDPREWAATRRFLRYYWSSEPEIFAAADPGKEPLPPPGPQEVTEACRQIRENLPAEERKLFLFMLVGIAEQVGDLLRGEQSRVRELAERCGIPKADWEAWLPTWTDAAAEADSHQDPWQADPWKILGLPQGSPAGEVRRRYLQLVRSHHPDRFAHLGKAHQDEAKRRMQSINVAYSRLCKSRS